VIPLNQLIPECLLALGAAFLLGNLAAYIRLRPAWREAKRRGSGGGQAASREGREGRRDQAAKGDARLGTPATASRTARGGRTPGDAGPGGQRRGQRRPDGAKAVDGAKAADGEAALHAGPGGQRRAQGATGREPRAGGRPKANGERRTAGAKAAERTRAGTSARVNARVGGPARSGAALPSRARVLANVVIGLVITLAALATLLRG
jgi:hypothetical protein